MAHISFFCFSSSSLFTPDPLAEKHPHRIILPPPRFTAGVVLLRWKASHSHLFFVSPERRTFPQKVFFTSSKIESSSEGAAPGTMASFLHGSLSAHGNAKHTWLWTLTPVFQQLQIHCRLAFGAFWLTLDHPDRFSLSSTLTRRLLSIIIMQHLIDTTFYDQNRSFFTLKFAPITVHQFLKLNKEFKLLCLFFVLIGTVAKNIIWSVIWKWFHI